MSATVILLNGIGSAGKSTLARALQVILPQPYLHLQMDTFLDMLPAAFQDHSQAFRYEEGSVDGNPIVEIRTGPVGTRLLDGMRHAIAAMARAGNNLIVDDVLCNGEMPDYDRLLKDVRFFRIGVMAPLEVIEAREKQRPDRMPGLARWQWNRVHEGIAYDLVVDTSLLTPEQGAARIMILVGDQAATA